MSNLVRNGLILLVCLLISMWAILPPSKKLQLGKDLAGGASLVYAVDIKPTDTSDLLEKVKQVVHERLDPAGVMEISVISQGRDRLEITMPLPNDQVKELRKAFEKTLKGLGSTVIAPEEFDRIATGPKETRTRWIAEHTTHDTGAAGRLEQAFRDFDALVEARKALVAADAEVTSAKDKIRNLGTNDPNDPILQSLNAALAAAEAAKADAVNSVAQASIALDATRASAISTGLTGVELRRVLLLSDKPVRLPNDKKEMVTRPSPRAAALEDIAERYPDQAKDVAAAVAAWNTYEKNRKSLDDAEDIVRILKGAGVLNFRITVKPGEHPQEQELRNQLRQGGPSAVKAEDAHFYKVNKLEGWAETIDDLDRMRQSPATYFLARGMVAEEYKGQPYILLWDRRGLRLTQDEGEWTLTKSHQSTDELGRPAIAFQMDAIGASKLGELTEKNVGSQMAVLLDDEVYTAPRLNSRISSSGQITGSFTQAELDYIIRVLGAGSLQAKLSPEPISRSVLGPQLGAENLKKGFDAGVVAFIVVGVFMVGYYFSCGLISMLALLFNLVLLLAAMALNQAAFTLPGIAGIILTFGQAVDANVLVYERMREEFNRGHDMRTAVRLGFSRALSAIVDGNVTTLIVCVVLGLFGTQEIKGFALTLGIGTVTTLIAQLFFTRYIFAVLVDKIGWRNASMLPMVGNNWLGKRLVPNIDWMGLRYISYTISAALMIMGLGFIIVQGRELLGTEFRGGTAVTIMLREEPAADGTTQRKLLERGEVERRVRLIGDNAPTTDPLNALQFAEVIAVNPDSSGLKSSTFTIKTLVTDANLVQNTLAKEFEKDLDANRPLAFSGSNIEDAARSGRVVPVTANTLGDVIERPEIRDNISDFYNGAAIVLDKISPPVSRAEVESRLNAKRNQTDFVDIAGRRASVRVTDGTDQAATGLVLLIKDNDIGYFDDPREWERQVRDSEWRLVRAALTQQQTLAEVQSFSPAVADTFRWNALWSVTLSTLFIIIYIWIRFNSIRYSLAAIVTTLHDCICAVGFVALATWLFNRHPQIAGALGILPFKIDLNVMAAIMTTLGYSLNDTIIVMDRIRENRGKLPYASRKVINDSINQTISRTLITSGTTVIAVMTLYLVGGEGIRVFAYTMLIGVFVGTFSSIAVAAPLVWSGKAEPEGATGSTGNQYDASAGEDRAAA